MNLHLFATAQHPLRPSSLSWLIACPVQSVLQMLEYEDSSGAAAQTGSLVHAAIAAFHLEPVAANRIGAAVDALRLHAGKFPLADANEARLYLEPYLCDPRNAHATFAVAPDGRPAVECRVELRLPPHAFDPTGQPVFIRGTLDQIRVEDGRVLVDDIKTGQTAGYAMLHSYAYQQAAYALAARQSGFPTAEPGRIIRVYGYRVRGARLPSPDGVFWSQPFDVTGATQLLDRVRLHVALIRRGEVDFGAGSHCSYCPLKGLDSCVPKANEKLFSLPITGN